MTTTIGPQCPDPSTVTDMHDTKPLSHIVSTLTLNSLQQEEFDRISKLYAKAYSILLDKWYRYAATKTNYAIDGADMRYIDRSLRTICTHSWLKTQEDQQVATFASNELCRHLREREAQGLPAPHPEFSPLVRSASEVVFYWGYDIKVKDHTVRVPVLGKATTGRFKYFSGSIKAIGIDHDRHEGFSCRIYFRENDAPGKPWQIGVDPIPQTPLNQKLRSAGIGFML